MKTKKTEIAVNESSGAEKVETIEKKTPQKSVKVRQKQTESTAKGEAALGSKKESAKRTKSAKKTQTQKEIKVAATDGKAERESRMAKARVERALRRKEAAEKRKQARAERAKKRAEAREKRLSEMRAKIEKRKQEKKALAEKRAAAKKEKAEKRAAEKEAKLRARAHAKATRNQNRAKKQAQKKSTQNRRTKERKDHEKRNKGYGGWIAAVVSLGVVTLALATTVTVGGIEIRNMQNDMITGYKGTMYELTGLMDNVDEDLDRVRVSASPAQQSRILTDLLVQARLAELDLEKMPMSAETDRNVTVFINRIAKECEMLLSKLRHGGTLSNKDFEELETLYRTNHEIREQVNGLLEKLTDKDMCSFMKEGKGALADAIADVENKTLLENNASFDKKMQKAEETGRKQTMPEKPTESRIDQVKAETLCADYFSNYAIKEFQCVGETVNPFYSAYNVQGYDEKGTLLFAEISQKDGALLRFDFYEDCSSETFDMKNAERIAEDFLAKLGYEDMEAVRLRKNGTMTDFTYVYSQDGVVYYPDEIRVKICQGRGVVTAFDATKYLKNHRDRVALNVKISLEEAQKKLHEKLSVEASRLAVVKAAFGERTAYEFFCKYGEENYFVYVDAFSGEELSILNAKNI